MNFFVPSHAENLHQSSFIFSRRGGRVVEGARLESVYTSKGYRGFESRLLRTQNKIVFLKVITKFATL